jgi:LacI family transcriptional regulator
MSQKLHKNPIEEMRDWIREGDLPEAIFVFSDDIALYVMDVLKDAGYRIPEDISIIGCGNMHVSEQTVPPLTTIDQHTYEMGTLSVQMLLKFIDKGNTTELEKNVIEPKLIIRESCRKA